MNINYQIKKIRMMPRSIERDMKVYYLYQYLHFLLHSRKISEKEFDNFKKIIGYKPLNKNIPAKDLNKSLLLLTCLYDVVLNNANNYNLSYKNSPSINIDEYIPYVIEFFNYIDNDIYKIYNKIKESNLLLFVNSINYRDVYGETHNIGKGKSSIIIKNDNNFRTLLTLVHEMGHAYAFYLNRNLPNRKPFFIDTECLPVTFEYLFMQFLRNNNLIDNKILTISEKNRLIANLSRMDIAYVYNDLLFELGINPCSMQGSKLIVLPKIYDMFSIIKPNKYLNEEKKANLKNYSNFYGYGFLFAMVMQERFIKNEKETKKFIKGFPNYAYNHLGYELIESISDDEYIDATSKYIDKVLSKTNSK